MKKIIGCICISIIMISTFSFAAYPEELENQEIQELQNQEESVEIDEQDISLISEEGEIYPSENNIIEDDIYKLEKDVTITGTINGNVYVIAENLKIENAIISGNVFSIAENTEIVNAEIDGSLYTIGENIKFSGLVYDVYCCGSSITFDVESYIWRDLKCVGSKVEMNGSVYKNCYLLSNELKIGENALVDGKLKYNAGDKVDISQEASIGEIEILKDDDNKYGMESVEGIKLNNYVDNIIDALQFITKTLVVSIVIVFGVNRFEKMNRTNKVAKEFAINVAKGLGILFLVPVVSVLLVISILGTPFGFIVFALYAIGLFVASSITSLEIAKRILDKKEEKNNKRNLILCSALISLVVWAIGFIPVLGGIIRFILVLIGLGIIWSIIFPKKKKEEINEN